MPEIQHTDTPVTFQAVSIISTRNIKQYLGSEILSRSNRRGHLGGALNGLDKADSRWPSFSRMTNEARPRLFLRKFRMPGGYLSVPC